MTGSLNRATKEIIWLFSWFSFGLFGQLCLGLFVERFCPWLRFFFILASWQWRLSFSL
jgi:hypothetical protein